MSAASKTKIVKQCRFINRLTKTSQPFVSIDVGRMFQTVRLFIVQFYQFLCRSLTCHTNVDYTEAR